MIDKFQYQIERNNILKDIVLYRMKSVKVTYMQLLVTWSVTDYSLQNIISFTLL